MSPATAFPAMSEVCHSGPSHERVRLARRIPRKALPARSDWKSLNRLPALSDHKHFEPGMAHQAQLLRLS